MPRSQTAIRQHIAGLLARSASEPVVSGTARRVLGPLQFPGKATAVIGMRRAGKTTFLHQQRAERLARGTPLERLPFLNFEDEQLAGMEAPDLALVLEEYYRRYPALRGTERVTLCLDEIQVVPGWERFVRRVLDRERVEIFLGGSSAALLSREIATAMRGRAWEVVLHPFAFDEVLRHRGSPIPAEPESLAPAERSGLESTFLDFLAAGGFPEAQGLDAATRRRLLSDYTDVTLFRDVVERHRVGNVTALRWVVRHLLANAAGLFSVEKVYAAMKSQGLGVSKDTVHQFLAYLQDAFLVRTVWVESESERRRMVNPRKCYPIDPALIAIYDRSGRANLGHALETVVLLELERRRCDVTYVRTREGFEVDFLARDGEGREELIQVCADARDRAVAERELRALESAGREHPRAAKRLLTVTQDGLPGALPAGAVAEPAYAWLLRAAP